MNSREHLMSIKNFPSYKVDQKGQVYNSEGIKLKQTINRDGYSMVKLCDNGYEKNCSVHRLVADAFFDGDHDGFEVNHIDGNKHNNVVENLEWVDNGENIRHADNLGLRSVSKGEKHYMCKITDEIVQEIRKSYIFRHPEFGTVGLAKKYGLSQQHVSNILNNRKRVKNDEK